MSLSNLHSCREATIGFVNLDIPNTKQNGGSLCVCEMNKWHAEELHEVPEGHSEGPLAKTAFPCPPTEPRWAPILEKSIFMIHNFKAPLFEKTDIGTQREKKEQFPSLYNYLCFLPPAN